MNIIATILSILSAVITLYTLMCFADIIMSWIPGAKFTKFGKFIASACDPYMNFFSKNGWLRFGNIDFSPIISLGILSLASSILGGIQSTGKIYFGGILGTIIYMIWNVASSILSLLLLLIIIRWIVLLINHGNTPYDSGWNQIDILIQRIVYKVSGTFVKRNVNYKTALLITWIAFLVILGAGWYFVNVLVHLCYQIPF